MNSSINTEKFGQFGDSIGGVIGSFWALAGVILFYTALIEQRKDFKTNKDALKAQINAFEQQIKEFELQRQELEETRKVFKAQSKTQQLQQFESTFFNMLEGHTSNIKAPDIFHDLFGKLDSIYYHVKQSIINKDYSYLKYNVKNIGLTKEKVVEIVNKFDHKGGAEIDISKICYVQLFNINQKYLGHYFRHLYHILKFIENHENENLKQAELDISVKTDFSIYADILQSRLSTYELVLLYYNMLFFPKLVSLVKKYNFLDNLPYDTLLDTSHKDFFDIELRSGLDRFKI